MKVKEVPQDGKVTFGDTTMVTYAVDDDGRITPVKSTGWDVQVAANRSLKEIFEQNAEEAKERVKKGVASPIEYYMHVFGLNEAELAQHMGLPKRKVRAHLKPEGFGKLDEATLARYADLFHVTVGELTDFMKEDA